MGLSYTSTSPATPVSSSASRPFSRSTSGIRKRKGGCVTKFLIKLRAPQNKNKARAHWADHLSKTGGPTKKPELKINGAKIQIEFRLELYPTPSLRGFGTAAVEAGSILASKTKKAHICNYKMGIISTKHTNKQWFI